MKKNITKTLESRIYKAKALNIKEKKTVNVDIPYNGKIALGDTVKTLNRVLNDSNIRIFKCENVERVSGLYTMTEAEFLSHAVEVKERNIGAFIARTLKVTELLLIGVNASDEYTEKTVKIIGEYNENELTEEYTSEDFMVCAIEKVSESTALYQMTDADFAKYGRKVEKEEN